MHVRINTLISKKEKDPYYFITFNSKVFILEHILIDVFPRLLCDCRQNKFWTYSFFFGQYIRVNTIEEIMHF